MNLTKTFPSFSVVLTLSILSLTLTSVSYAKKYTIQFGGTQGIAYSPDSLSVFVGDTIQWTGSFSQYSLHSSEVPPGALSFGPIDTGTSFSYVIKVPGLYNYQSDKYVSLGMTGSFTATARPPLGLTNEGREFFLGMIYPTFNNNPFNYSLSSYFNVSALITSYYSNDIVVSYYDESGTETGVNYHIAPKSSLKIPLDIAKMRIDTNTPGQPVFKSCHITSQAPVAVQYLSTGASSCGSYLALPVLGLGKNYVTACYNDNPGNGAFYGGDAAIDTFEYSSGVFMVIATENGTSVKITPAATTTDHHTGVNTGKGSNGTPNPYTITLNKGQCYQARSDGRDENVDLSGSLIEATKPVAVISGHEDAFLGSIDDYHLTSSVEGRDLMIEQMIPVEMWDSAGFVSIPLAEAIPPGVYGHGDSYRMYAYDVGTVKIHADVQGISGGYDFNASRFNSPIPERLDVISPVDIFTTDGHKISVMQYDERSHNTKLPIPAPSMMTIVPISRWRTSYDFAIPDFAPTTILDEPFINVISSQLNKIMFSVNGSSPKLLSALASSGTFSILSNHDDVKAVRYKIGSGSYHLFSDYPFIVYNYSMREASFNTSYLGNHNYLDYNFEYAAPSGIRLSTGVQTSFVIDTTLHCSSWHICIRDTSKITPGIKAIMLLDDPDGAYFSPGYKNSNVGFDATSADFLNGELHPNLSGSGSYCFDANIINPLLPASAPIEVVDNGGNVVILQLNYKNPALQLSTTPPTVSRADSIVFPVNKIGDQICTTFVVKNIAAKGGVSVNLSSAQLTSKDTSYKIQSVIPALPHSFAGGDSLLVQVCYTATDSARHRDSLVIKTDCFNIAVSLDAHGSTGLIDAADQDFGSITVGNTSCKNILIKNVGSSPFTLTKQFVLSDTANYSVDTTKLPAQIKPGNSISINVCFHPVIESTSNAGIDWATDLEASFAHSIKSHSALTGIATPKEGVKLSSAPTPFSIHPNPVSGNSVIVSFDLLTEASVLNIYDVLGREVYHNDISPDISRIEIPIHDLPEGIYYIKLNSASGSATERFLKVK